MGGIFISYRRQDSSGHAGRLRDHLRACFGDLVFQDVDSIPDGEIFETVLDKALNACDVALVVIGREWLSSTDAHGRRRLDDPQDWVRIETRLLLTRSIRVIPILVGGATMPRVEELPEDLQTLAKRQARELRDTAWDADIKTLIQRLEEIVHQVSPKVPSSTPRSISLRRPYIAALGSIAAIILIAGAWLFLREPAAPRIDGNQRADLGSSGDSALPNEKGADPSSLQSADPVAVAAKNISLLGTWRIDDFSGFERPAGFATSYEMKVSESGVKLIPADGDAAKDTSLVKQIKGRSVTLVPRRADGKESEFMYQFELSSDGAKLDNCMSIATSDFRNLGPCYWRYTRALPSKSKAVEAQVKCGEKLAGSSVDPACVEAAKTIGLIGAWRADKSGQVYRFAIEGNMVRLIASASAKEGATSLAIRSINNRKLTIGLTPFSNDRTQFDVQQSYEYELASDGSRLANCRALTLLSTRTEEAHCTDVPVFMVRDAAIR